MNSTLSCQLSSSYQNQPSRTISAICNRAVYPSLITLVFNATFGAKLGPHHLPSSFGSASGEVVAGLDRSDFRRAVLA